MENEMETEIIKGITGSRVLNSLKGAIKGSIQGLGSKLPKEGLYRGLWREVL